MSVERAVNQLDKKSAVKLIKRDSKQNIVENVTKKEFQHCCFIHLCLFEWEYPILTVSERVSKLSETAKIESQWRVKSSWSLIQSLFILRFFKLLSSLKQ